MGGVNLNQRFTYITNLRTALKCNKSVWPVGFEINIGYVASKVKQFIK